MSLVFIFNFQVPCQTYFYEPMNKPYMVLIGYLFKSLLNWSFSSCFLRSLFLSTSSFLRLSSIRTGYYLLLNDFYASIEMRISLCFSFLSVLKCIDYFFSIEPGTWS